MTTTALAFGTQVIGQTEKALNAILDRRLAGTGVTEPQWVTLTLAVVSGGSIETDQLINRVGGSLKVGEADAKALVTTLTTAGLLAAAEEGGVTVTDAGRALWTRIRTAVGQITHDLWGDLPTDDLEAAGRVLNTVLTRANALLAA